MRARRDLKRDQSGFARELRQRSTAAENLLWPHLRAHQLGYHIRRQHPIGHAIADFACPERRLVIEIDGGIHRIPDIAEHDQIRGEVLAQLGWKVLRITNEEVFADVKAVIERIRQALDESTASTHDL